jgi:hypothetical protein
MFRADIAYRAGRCVVGLLILLLVRSGSASSMAELITVFEAQLTERGAEFRLLDDGRYEIAAASGVVTVALDNLSRRYERDGDVEAVSVFLDALLAQELSLPPWEQARRSVFAMLEGADLEIGEDTISRPLSAGAMLIPVYFDGAAGTLRLLRGSDLATWGLGADELWAAADASLDAIMRGTDVSYLDAGGFRLGVIEAGEPHKASLIRAPSLRSKVEDVLGWPILAVAPSRGFVFLIGKADADRVGRLARAVVEEFESAEYPISMEVWEVSDAGIDAIGDLHRNR